MSFKSSVIVLFLLFISGKVYSQAGDTIIYEVKAPGVINTSISSVMEGKLRMLSLHQDSIAGYPARLKFTLKYILDSTCVVSDASIDEKKYNYIKKLILEEFIKVKHVVTIDGVIQIDCRRAAKRYEQPFIFRYSK